jgi:membrane protease YdiL (CAAX protease family)
MQCDPDIFRLILAIGWVMLSFGAYYLLYRKVIPAGGPEMPVQGMESNVSRILQLRLLGMFLFGALPGFFIILVLRDPLSDYGAVLQFRELPPWWIYPVLVLIPVTTHRTAGSEKNLNAYPQMRIRAWTPFILLVSGISWVLYLVAYEFLFRGLLLSASVAVMTGWQAITLNCILYALAHL